MKNIARALRLPFISASITPFIFGSLIQKANFNFSGFIFGFLAVVATHLSANLINDYADSKSGADWHDKKFFGLFGGSKLIQEHTFSERFYFRAAAIAAGLSCLSVIILSLVIKSIIVLVYYLAIIFLSWAYSQPPFKFSYRRVGELVIFLLFGPALVMGGYFIQTGIFPDIKSFVLSLPFGFLTTAILFANEVPDLSEDKKAGKLTWVSITGQYRAFGVYYLLMLSALLSILMGIVLGYLGVISSLSFLCIFLAIKSANIIRKYPEDKLRLFKSSKLTIAIHNIISAILITDTFL